MVSQGSPCHLVSWPSEPPTPRPHPPAPCTHLASRHHLLHQCSFLPALGSLGCCGLAAGSLTLPGQGELSGRLQEVVMTTRLAPDTLNISSSAAPTVGTGCTPWHDRQLSARHIFTQMKADIIHRFSKGGPVGCPPLQTYLSILFASLAH
jgi:hypothetical protein